MNQIQVIDCPQIPYEEEEDCIGLDKCVYITDKGVKRINYPNMATAIARANNCIYHKGLFYTPDGSVTAEFMRHEISAALEAAGWTDRLDLPTTSILNTIRDKYNQEDFAPRRDLIPFRNGDLLIGGDKWVFRRGEKSHVPYRLNVDFVEEEFAPSEKAAPVFNKWLEDVFVSEDIITVQELLGYCLIPSTAAQEAFILVGEAGVGKSVLTHLLSSVFGNAYQEVSIDELSGNRFALPMVENRLVIYDDDLKTTALAETGIFKKLVTATQPIKAERKYEQPYNFLPYCTVIANSNDMLQTLYDDSNGFYRRLHPIHVRDKAPGRVDISDMGEKVSQEKNAIVMWALKGLVRVIDNGFKIHWSERSRLYMNAEKTKGVHFGAFFETVFLLDSEGIVASEEICKLYKSWCRQNAVQELSVRRLQNWLGGNAEKLNISKTLIGKKRIAGYQGVKIREEWKQSIIF